MSRNNGKSAAQDVYDEKVILVPKTTDLPYTYIPYESVRHARVNHPDDTLYVFEGKAPNGYKIVAFPILMVKPKEEEEEVANASS